MVRLGAECLQKGGEPPLTSDPRTPLLPDRTFEAIILSWDGTAVPDRQADASGVRERVEALCRAGVHVVVVSGTHVGNIDGQLQSRPQGPGTLHFCLNRGSEVFEVGPHGPILVWRRKASGEEEAALDQAADIVMTSLAERGLPAKLVSQRLNRRKFDLIPEPEWAQPPRGRAAELAQAVDERLRAHGLEGLNEVVELVLKAAREAGLVDGRVTSDLKHVELGLTDKSDSIRWALDDLWRRGIGPGLWLIAGDEFGPLGGVPGSDALMLVPEAARALAVSVGVEPEGVPAGVVHLPAGPPELLAILDDQLQRRAARRVPCLDEDPAWTVWLEDAPHLRRMHETLVTLANGYIGVRGARSELGEDTDPLLCANGIYMNAKVPRLLPGPLWTGLSVVPARDGVDRCCLDLRTGVLLRVREQPGKRPLRSVRFVSVVRPEAMGMRAEGGAGQLAAGQPVTAPPDPVEFERGRAGSVHWGRSRSNIGGGITVAARDRHHVTKGRRCIERLAACSASQQRVANWTDVVARLGALESLGFDRLLAEHREAWARRWENAQVTIEGDDEAQLGVRFAMFHLMSSAPEGGEAAVGARGLSGQAYNGHVFWDSDVFVLPTLAAISPRAARAMLEYRIQRLPAARQAAKSLGLPGACFPWESAYDGRDVTPRFVKSREGAVVPIRTGQHEEHITADVAWAAWEYVQWTGDEGFLEGPGRALFTETARYWAARVRFDDQGRGHLYGVIGPDEYHEIVDDSTYTNVMARWNLRRAAELVEGDGRGGTPEEAAQWRRIAEALCDGYNPSTGLYEQFAGYWRLEPLLITEIATSPVAADMLLGRDRIASTQIIKQADVLMLHHLVPDEVAAGSLRPNLAFYDPRTAHGSSLSPAIYAALLAQAGEADRALELFRIAWRLDLDDLTGTTAAGLHVATLGGVWQALAYGFLGVRPERGVLRIDPHLPEHWPAVELRVRFHGRPVRMKAEHHGVTVSCEVPLRVRLADGTTRTIDPPGERLVVGG